MHRGGETRNLVDPLLLSQVKELLALCALAGFLLYKARSEGRAFQRVADPKRRGPPHQSGEQDQHACAH